MRIAGWMIWSAVAVLTLCYWANVFESWIRRRGFTYALLIQVSLLTLLLMVTALGLRKAHLLWLTPTMLVVGILISPPYGKRFASTGFSFARVPPGTLREKGNTSDDKRRENGGSGVSA